MKRTFSSSSLPGFAFAIQFVPRASPVGFPPVFVSPLLHYHLGYAAVSEDPVFRGFLWGVLRKSGWRELWIWLFQAGLFVLAHLYYLQTSPIMFFFGVPLGALVLGWLAWRSRSIATSVAAHDVVNGLGRAFAILVAVLR